MSAPSLPRREPIPRRSIARRAARVLAWSLATLLVVLPIAAATLVRTDLGLDELAPRYAAPPSQFIDVEGMRVHVRDEGSGPPLVLIHGTASSLHTWDGWVAAIGGHHRIIRLDLPGFGLTGPAPDDDYSAARFARLVLAVLDQRGVERADFAGNSLGGRVAITLALAHPERVGRLVLIDSAGMPVGSPPPLVRMARTPVVRSLLLHLTPRFLVRRNVEQVYGDPARITEALVDRYQDMTRRAGNRRALVVRLNGPADPDLDGRLGELRMPVLLQWGERDRWMPLADGRRMHAAIAGSQLRTYPDAGHVPMEELPVETARDAEAFLTAAAAAPTPPR